MNNVLKFLLLAFGCIIVIGLITLSGRISKKGESDTEQNLETYNRAAGDAEDIELKIFDGQETQGSEIKELIRKYSSHDYLSIKVINGKTNTEDYIHESTITSKEATAETEVTTVAAIGDKDDTAISDKPSDTNYINDVGIFKTEVIYDQNDVVACLRFTQQ
ncbi:MAG TPA: hypothetical protein VJ888_05000 [Mobilitalea sp.]|nr:hypothetical protein [Mobilitalea sp.]